MRKTHYDESVQDILRKAQLEVQAHLGYPVDVVIKMDCFLDAVPIDVFISECAALFNLTPEEVLRHSRKRELVLVRQIMMTVQKKHSSRSLKTIGELIGGYDHTTVMHALNTIRDLLDTGDLVATEYYFKIFQLIKNYAD